MTKVYNHFFDFVQVLDAIIIKSYNGVWVITKSYRCLVCVRIIKS